MNCFFCQTDITNYRSTGLSKPAGSFYCLYCANLHQLSVVVCTINSELKPVEAIIHIDHIYYFRIDYCRGETYLVGPTAKYQTGILLTFDKTDITPARAKNKLKTYLWFS